MTTTYAQDSLAKEPNSERRTSRNPLTTLLYPFLQQGSSLKRPALQLGNTFSLKSQFFGELSFAQCFKIVLKVSLYHNKKYGTQIDKSNTYLFLLIEFVVFNHHHAQVSP